ncbi:hypothetical protein NDU88_001616 [Pleurodeles waltl]|uniref:Uncharacterized protein n=1 Tax=Pleurodeles waltl TaxID=8319 RepID=A0AAV7S7U7_PLEWA|nr:hypothetical protein NDU88_001616 [Pleurodeles waltl]
MPMRGGGGLLWRGAEREDHRAARIGRPLSAASPPPRSVAPKPTQARKYQPLEPSSCCRSVDISLGH